MANDPNSVQKLYIVRGVGTAGFIKELERINALFAEQIKLKAALNGAKAQTEDPAALAAIEKQLEAVTAQEQELVKAKASRLEAAREELAQNEQLLGSYNELKAAIAGISSANAGEVGGPATAQQAEAVNNLAIAQVRLTETAQAAAAAQDQVSAAILRGRAEQAADAAVSENRVATLEQMAAAEAQVLAEVRAAQAATEEMRATTVNLTEAEAAEEAQALRLSERLVELSVQAANVGAAMKALTQQYLDGSLSKAQFLERGAELLDQQALIRTELQAGNLELKNQAKLELANAESINEWRARVGLLTKERNNLNLTTQEGIAQQERLNAEINRYNQLIKENVDLNQQQKINIGNYPTVTAELTALRQEMQRLVAAGEGDSVAFRQAAARAGELTAATQQTTLAIREEAAANRDAGAAIAAKVQNALRVENIVGRVITSFTRMAIHFAVFTLVIKGIELLVEKMDNLGRSTSDAAKVAQAYAEAAKSEAAASAEQIASLISLQQILQATTATRTEQLSALATAKESIGEYIGLLQAEDIGTQKVNQSIEAQVALIRQRDAVKAATSTVGDALKKQQDAEAQLNKVLGDQLGFWEGLKGPAENYAIALKALTSANNQLKSAEELLSDAQNGNVKANKALIAELTTAITRYQDLSRAAQANLAISGKNHATIQKEIDLYSSLVTQLQAVRKAKEDQLKILEPPPIKDDKFKQQAALDEAAVLSSKKNSKEELAAKKTKIKDDLAASLHALEVEYTTQRHFRQQNLADEAGYQAQVKLLKARAIREQADAEETFQKKNKPKKVHDFTAEQAAVDKFNIEQIAQLREADYRIDAEQQRLIFEDTKQSLDKRLQAYQEYSNDLRLEIQTTKAGEIAAVKDTLATVKKLRAKEAAGGKLTPAQKKLVDEEIGLTAELSRLEKDKNAALAKIDADGAKQRTAIAKSDVQERLNVLTDLRAAEEQDRDEDLRKNQQNFANHLISYRTFKEREKAINDVSAAAESEAVIHYLQQQLDALKGNDDATIALRKALNSALNDFYKADAKNFDDVEALKEQRRKKFQDAIKEAAGQAAQTLADGVISAQQRQIDKDNELAQTQLDNAKQVALAAAQSAAEKAAIEKEYQAKNDALKRAEFEKNKDLSEKQLALDFAVATGRAAASAVGTGPAWWIDFGTKEAAVALEYAAKLAVISAQKFAQGGEVPTDGGEFGGRSHAHGGTRFRFRDREYEAEAEELAIINKRSARKRDRLTVSGTPKQIASAINAYGGGLNFAPGATTRIGRFEYGGNLGSTLPAPYFAPPSAGTSTDPALLAFLQQATAQMSATQQQMRDLRVGLDPNLVDRWISDNQKHVNLGRL